MSEIYWISRLGIICTAGKTIFGLSIGVLVIVLFFHLVHVYDEYYSEQEMKQYNRVYCSNLKKIIPIIIVSGLISLFVPTKSELIMIYGIGSVIDYIQQNDKAKELPDKVINALDMYLNDINEENNSYK